MGRTSCLAVLVVARVASAQPITQPDEAPPLAQIRDDKELAETLSAIVQDPAVKVDDAKARPLAQALMTEGVHQLQAKQYDQALANFLEAYNKLPSPNILINIGSTLRDMGRLADAANTYQRYIEDPATSSKRIAEVKELLLRLDEQLTILTIRVFPRGSELSIDGGPFVPVGSSLVTRVRPGIHMVRVKKGDASTEITVNGFEGENKDVSAALKVDVTPDVKPATPNPTSLARPGFAGPRSTPDGSAESIARPGSAGPRSNPEGSAESIHKLPIERTLPDHVDGWLVTGTQYASDDANSRERRVRTGYAGPEVTPIVPTFTTSDTGDAIVAVPTDEDAITSGVLAIARIDGNHGKGFAGGLGIAYASSDHVEIDVAGLRSDVWGAYVGARYRFLTGWLRPYLGGGIPAFYCQDFQMNSRIAPGVRITGGIELMINGHLSVEGDLGYEHFFNVDNTPYEPDVFVPTVGLIGRL